MTINIIHILVYICIIYAAHTGPEEGLKNAAMLMRGCDNVELLLYKDTPTGTGKHHAGAQAVRSSIELLLNSPQGDRPRRHKA